PYENACPLCDPGEFRTSGVERILSLGPQGAKGKDTMAQTALILGSSGKIGSRAAEAFERAGWQVRHYDRRTGDMVRAAQGADVMVNGLNPPRYHDWARLIP